jgi:hypothetical protein
VRHFFSLSSELQARVALAVLLDGADAQEILGMHGEVGERLARAAKEAFSLSLDVRLPLLGTLLRESIHQGEAQSRQTMHRRDPDGGWV